MYKILDIFAALEGRESVVTEAQQLYSVKLEGADGTTKNVRVKASSEEQAKRNATNNPKFKAVSARVVDDAPEIKEGEEVIEVVAEEDLIAEMRRLSGQSVRESEKKAKKDYDGDGEIESEKDEVHGSHRKAAGLDEAKPDFLDMDKDGDKKEPMKKAIKDKEKVDECWGGNESPLGGSMMGGQEEQEGGMNISTSHDTRRGTKSVTITADGEAAEELMQMLKMAGIGGPAGEGQPGHEEAEHHSVTVVPMDQEEGDMEEAQEPMANSPAPEYTDTNTINNQGGDLNKPKQMYKHNYKGGDNPMAMSEAESRLWQQYEGIKRKV
jgi:hypothetical protein